MDDFYTEPLKLKSLAVPKPIIDHDHEDEGRFQIIPINAIKDDYAQDMRDNDDDHDHCECCCKKARNPQYTKKSTASLGHLNDMLKTSTAETYCEDYLRQQREATKRVDDLSGKLKAEALEAKKNAEDQRRRDNESNDQRARARDLQDQIGYWKQQSGQGYHDESRVAAEIDELNRQLGSIPQNLW